jgi:hypothetical protein
VRPLVYTQIIHIQGFILSLQVCIVSVHFPSMSPSLSSCRVLTLMWIRIRLPNLMRIRIRHPAYEYASFLGSIPDIFKTNPHWRTHSYLPKIWRKISQYYTIQYLSGKCGHGVVNISCCRDVILIGKLGQESGARPRLRYTGKKDIQIPRFFSPSVVETYNWYKCGNSNVPYCTYIHPGILLTS